MTIKEEELNKLEAVDIAFIKKSPKIIKVKKLDAEIYSSLKELEKIFNPISLICPSNFFFQSPVLTCPALALNNLPNKQIIFSHSIFY